MTINIRYTGQSRHLAGAATEQITLGEAAGTPSPLDLLGELAQRHPALQRLLVPEHPDRPPPILLFVNDLQVDWTEPPLLRDGDCITIVSPISGG